MTMRLLAAALLAVASLAGCGTAVNQPASVPLVGNYAARTATKTESKLDKKSYEKGLAIGIDKATGKTDALPKQGLEKVDKLSYDYGLVVGLMQGSIRSFKRINGSFDVYEWKAFCYMNFEAMKDAKAAIAGNPELAAKAAIPLGMITGAIQSFSSINGNFDVYQWKSFAETNLRSLQSTLDALLQVQI